MPRLFSHRLNCDLFTSANGQPLVLPSLFSVSLQRTGCAKVLVETTDGRGCVNAELKDSVISEKTVKTVLAKLDDFLSWLEQRPPESHLRLETHHNISDEWIKHYINDHLIGEMGASDASATQAVMALKYYFNWLASSRITTTKSIGISPQMRGVARQQRKLRSAVQYITPALRNIIYANAHSYRDEALLRCGGEVGVRTKELRGFTLNDFNYGGRKKHPGLLSLFTMLDEDPHRQTFEFYLRGVYSKGKRNKGGSGRQLYINRDLLELMQRYYMEERPPSDSDHLFLTDSSSYRGKPISERQGTNTFAAVRDEVIKKQNNRLFAINIQALDEEHSFHTLRHSFGTDIFHKLATEDGVDIDNIDWNSRAYLTVAEMLGHETKGTSPPATTALYIRLSHMKNELLKAEA